jgi:CheY-like chemotaxis protein
MKSVLVVEDDEKSRRLLSDVVGAKGYEVRSADSGEAALQQIEQCLPALVLLDIHLPGMDGYATLAAIRAHAGGAELPVVAVTASVMGSDRSRIFEAGFSGLLEKPVRLHLLADILARFA